MMAGKFLAGVAGIALMAASGAAFAADIPPLGAEAGVPGHTVSVLAEAGIGVFWNSSTISAPVYFDLYGRAAVDVKFQSGFGITVYKTSNIPVSLPFVDYFTVGGRFYRTMGAFEVGFSGVVRGGLPPLNVNSYEFGPDVSYETERYTITNNTSFAFFMGVYQGWENRTTIDVDVSEKVSAYAEFEFEDGPSFDLEFDIFGNVNFRVAPRVEIVPNFDFGVEVGGPVYFGTGVAFRFPLGVITPYTSVFHSWTGGNTSIDIGVELDKPLGNGPFSLVGYAEYGVGLESGYPPFHAFNTSLGIRYELGDDVPSPPPGAL